MKAALLTVSDVSYRYQGSDWQLAGIDVVLKPGDVLGIVGPNGSGKSTLLKLAAGILVPVTGRVCWQDQPLRHLSRRDIAQRLGFLPQGVTPSYDPTVAELVGMGRFCRQQGLGFVDAGDQAVIDRCLCATETDSLADRRLSQLSGGERQRAFLASVLAQEPRVLLLDEPTTGLDLHHQVAFFKLLSTFAKEDLATAVVTHNWNLAAQFCTQLLLLKEGQRLAYGPVAEVMQAQRVDDLYGSDLLVSAHPTHGHPIVLPR